LFSLSIINPTKLKLGAVREFGVVTLREAGRTESLNERRVGLANHNPICSQIYELDHSLTEGEPHRGRFSM